jgi:hypothetical protein
MRRRVVLHVAILISIIIEIRRADEASQYSRPHLHELKMNISLLSFFIFKGERTLCAVIIKRCIFYLHD